MDSTSPRFIVGMMDSPWDAGAYASGDGVQSAATAGYGITKKEQASASSAARDPFSSFDVGDGPWFEARPKLPPVAGGAQPRRPIRTPGLPILASPPSRDPVAVVESP